MIQKIVVCGAGTMGSGIAQVAAQSGYNTVVFDVNETVLEKSRQQVAAGLKKFADKQQLPEAALQQMLGRLQYTSAIENCTADLIIEAVIEDLAVKKALFKKLAAVSQPHTIFATNTSSISIDLIAAEMVEKERVVGLHFFNPAPLMKLVEIVKSSHTNQDAIEQLTRVVQQMGKIPVLCKDAPGFIVNRVARHYYLEAMKLVREGKATIETADAVLEGAGFKMGPFKLMDLIGLDVNYSVSNIVYEALGKPQRLTPSVLQKEKIAAGELGRKTGKGFYKYSA